MKKMITLACLGLFVATGCMMAPGGGAEPIKPNDGPYHKWFNPDGKQVGDNQPQVCTSKEVAHLPDVIPPLSAPPSVAEGYSFAKIDLRVEALLVKAKIGVTQANLCIPVAVHAHVNVGGINAPITTVDQGVVQTPWDALRNTPYEATGIIAWKNTLPSGPVVNINWSAKYEDIIDPVNRADMVIGMACSVFVNGVAYSRTISVNVDREIKPLPGAQGAQAVTGPFVQCSPPAFTPRAAL